MSEQQRASAASGDAQGQIEETVDPTPPAAEAAPSASTAGVDDLLDEIDGVLEANAEEFVRGFVQKGGQ